MFNMKEYINKTFELTLDNNQVLHIFAPKVKYRREISELISSLENSGTLDDLVDVTLKIINFNADNKTITKEEIEEMCTEDVLVEFINRYSNWLIGVVDEKN